MPRIDVASETREARTDGELLTCESATLLPLAQRHSRNLGDAIAASRGARAVARSGTGSVSDAALPGARRPRHRGSQRTEC